MKEYFQKKKIAIYNLNSYPELAGGSEISCLELAEHLKKNGINVSVVALHKFKNGFKRFNCNNINVFKLPLLNIYFPDGKKKRYVISKFIWHLFDICNIPMALLLCLWLKFYRFDIVHTNNIKGVSPCIFPLLWLFRFRIIHTTRDFYLLDKGAWYRDINNNHNLLKYRLSRLYALVCSKFINHVVYNSEYMKRYHNLCGFFLSQNQSVIYNGFDTAKYSLNGTRKENKKNFGYIGRLSKDKGIDTLIINFMKFEEGKYNLIIAGFEKDDFLQMYSEIEEKINSRNDIFFIGFVNNIDFYNQVDCVIVPSKYNEPFGRVAMEAIFFNKVVIVSNKGGLPEQIILGQILSGVKGVVCENEDYFSVMKDIFEKKTEDVNIFNLYVFSMDNCVSKYQNIYFSTNKI